MSAGHVAVVTGGARGIGFAVAESLAAAGYSTVILDNGTALDGQGRENAPVREAAAALVSDGYRAEGLLCDVSDWRSVSTTAADIAKRLGPVEVVANVAGILRPGPFLDDTEDTWKAVLSAHVGGHLNVIQAFLPMMVARRAGHIVNFTSTAALLGSRRQPAYSTAKESIVGLTRYLGRRLTGTGVRVNAVSPGAETRMSNGLRKMAAPPRAVELFADKDPAFVGRFVRSLVGGSPESTGRVYLVTGRYVAEYDHIRQWKWAALDGSYEDDDVAERMELVLRRPHPRVIGPWPTRDFRYLDLERNWEGTSIGPDLLAGEAPAMGAIPEGPVLLGINDERTDLLGRATQCWPAGAIEPRPSALMPSGPARRGALAVLPPSGGGSRGDQTACGDPSDTKAVCAGLAEILRYVQWGIGMTGPHPGAPVLLVIPGPSPWLETGSTLVDWMLWYGAVGAVRGGAATEAIYKVRVNGLVVAPQEEGYATAVATYALAEGRDWLNGYVLQTDPEGVGLLGDERPLWQCFSGQGDAPLPGTFRNSFEG